MDPLTALSLAANVVALAETSIRVLLLLKQVHHRGSLEANDAIEQWAEDVSSNIQVLRDQIPPQPTVTSPLEKRVHQFARGACDTSDELKRLLHKVAYHKGQAGQKRSALNQVLRTHLKKGQIESLELRLKKCESDLDSSILRDLYVRFGKADVLNTDLFAQLNLKQQSIITQIVDNNGRLTTTIGQMIKESEKNILDSHHETKTAVVQSEHNLSTQLQQIQLSDRNLRQVASLLNSLRFDSINQRQNYIQQRVSNYGTTYKWIFEKGKAFGFVEWLASNEALFWINGKPGSGKSSLVNYIFQELQPRGAGWSALNQWAAPAALQVLSFFFYRPAGDDLQKSFHGLWQSLCFQLLNEDRDLAEQILRDDAAPQSIRRHLQSGLDTRLSWLTKDLRLFFDYIVSKTTRHIFLLVDGLDESTEDHYTLLDTVKALALLKHLKVCCSSRPDSPFRTGLMNTPSLRVQDLTHDDIEKVVSRTLRDTAAKTLVKDIAHRAEGVFLWAHIVMIDTRRGLNEGESLEELTARVRDTPNEMTKLFAAMLRRAHPAHLKRPKPYLQYILLGYGEDEYSSRTVDLSELLFTECDQVELSECLDSGLSSNFLDELTNIAGGLESQVLARTAGLVEIHLEQPSDRGDGPKWGPLRKRRGLCADYDDVCDLVQGRTIQFIHRTAFDFVEDDPAGQEFLSRCSLGTREAYVNLIRANAARITFGIDHPLRSARKDGIAVGVLRLSFLALKAQETFLDHQNLLASSLTVLYADAGLGTQSTVHDTVPLSLVMGLKHLPGEMPLEMALTVSLTCHKTLFGFLDSLLRTFSKTYQQQVMFLLWLYVASSWDRESWQLYIDFLTRNPTLADLQPNLVQSTTRMWSMVRWTGYTANMAIVHAWRQVRGPFWVCLLACCLENNLSAYGESDFYSHLSAQHVLAMLRTTKISLCTTVELRIRHGEHSVDFIVPEDSSQPGDFGAGHGEIVVYCTVGGIFDSILAEESIKDPGGPVPCAHILAQPVRWCPSGCKVWLDLQAPQRHTDHRRCGAEALFRWRAGNSSRGVTSGYEVNWNYVVQPLAGEMDKLSRTKLDAVIKNHFNAKTCSEGQFCWAWRRTYRVSRR